MTFTEAVTTYMERARVRLRPRTWSNRRSVLRQICAELGERPLTAITRGELQAYVERRLERVKPVSINTELRAYKALANWWREQGLDAIAPPRPLRERPALRVRSWSPAQVAKLMFACQELAPAIAPIVFLLANTGLRCGEALALRWERVDLSRRLIGVWPSSEWCTKSGRPREVPINDELIELLRALPRRSPYVFATKRGARYARWPQRAFDRAREAAGLRGGPHTLRHSYATEFLARGGSLAMLAQILGHSDERVTRIYAHLRPDHLQAARNLVRFSDGKSRC
jgi:integrase